MAAQFITTRVLILSVQFKLLELAGLFVYFFRLMLLVLKN